MVHIAHAWASSAAENVRAAHTVHNASSAAGEPKVYPMPVPHFAVECGVQTVCPVWSANLPPTQVAQVAGATGPSTARKGSGVVAGATLLLPIAGRDSRDGLAAAPKKNDTSPHALWYLSTQPLAVDTPRIATLKKA